MMAQVRVAEGYLEGEKVVNEYGGEYYSFKGIPYAEPPVGDLRFKAPQPKKPWDGVRSAKEFGPMCHQYDMITKSNLDGSEDCLYVNVYTPDVKPADPLPVMFWIHGGGFISGCGNDIFYGPQFLLRKNIILVTFNYRLEVLGFLCLDTEDVPGNAGMKDQVAALRWVKKNINNFGGDPENITIFGESAGAGSVSYHTVSPMSKGLFKRAIIQSGAINNWWAFSPEPRIRATALARKLGFTSEDDKELYEFFKSQPVENLINTYVPITLSALASEAFEVNFSIVSEKKFGDNERFFYGDVHNALRHQIHDGIEVIIGHTSDEGFMKLALDDPNKMINLASNFHEYFIPTEIADYIPAKEKFAIGKKVREFYFKNSEVSMENLEKLVQYSSMDMFTFGTRMAAKFCATRSKTYLYKFTCKSELNAIIKAVGLHKYIDPANYTSHADDLMYIFKTILTNENLDMESEIFKMIDNVTTLWTNFAKFGNPTPDAGLGVKWLPYSLEEQDYMEIGNQLVPGKAPDNEEIQFWEDIFRKYLPQAVLDQNKILM